MVQTFLSGIEVSGVLGASCLEYFFWRAEYLHLNCSISQNIQAVSTTFLSSYTRSTTNSLARVCLQRSDVKNLLESPFLYKTQGFLVGEAFLLTLEMDNFLLQGESTLVQKFGCVYMRRETQVSSEPQVELFAEFKTELRASQPGFSRTHSHPILFIVGFNQQHLVSLSQPFILENDTSVTKTTQKQADFWSYHQSGLSSGINGGNRNHPFDLLNLDQYQGLYGLKSLSMDKCEKLKDLGNSLFKQKKYTEATNVFLQAVTFIESGTQPYASSQSEIGKLYLNLLTNAALCCLNLKQSAYYLKAIDVCSKALAIDPDHAKGLYRRGLSFKELGEQEETVGDMDRVAERYASAKRDLERLCLLDRKNEIASQKLSETIKNIARIRVLSREADSPMQSKTVSTTGETRGPSKPSLKMETIMKSYKMDQVVKYAQEKSEQALMKADLPQSKAQLDKAIKQLVKKPEVFKQYFLRFPQGHLQKLDPGYDLLFTIVTSMIQTPFLPQQEAALKTLVTSITRVKSFKLMWKGFIQSQKKQIRQKLQSILRSDTDLASYFQ